MTPRNQKSPQSSFPHPVEENPSLGQVRYSEKVYCFFTAITVIIASIVTAFPLTSPVLAAMAILVTGCAAWFFLAWKNQDKNGTLFSRNE